MSAAEQLAHALLNLADGGKRTPCQSSSSRDRWTSDDAEHRGWAATVCVTLACPVLLQCHAAADEHGEKFGVFGGRDRTAATRKAASA